LPFLFALTLFVSASLLFLVQPMIAKMILPRLGGTPAVWTTCMVFFQAVLLAGYAYAHGLTARLGTRKQVAVHSLLILLPFLVLPLSIQGWTPPRDSDPRLWLLGLLTVSVGLPFFVLSATAPLLQKWLAGTGHPSGKDPYYLYAASNAGSMLALLSYPALVEPYLHLATGSWASQVRLWSVGYGILVVLLGACALVVWQASRTPAAEEARKVEAWGPQTDPDRFDDDRPSLWRQLHWVALAFVPSSLMLGVTTYITLDIAAIPLLWIIPLALYLLSFILVFARWPLSVHQALTIIMPLALLVLVFVYVSATKLNVLVWIALLLAVLLLVALVCHGELARTRPSSRYLTQFYLLMSVGGVLGGVFNALVAPLVFSAVAEYPLVLVCACLLLPRPPADADDNRLEKLVLDVLVAAVIGLVTFSLAGLLTGSLPHEFAGEHLLSRAAAEILSWLSWLQTHALGGIEWASQRVHLKASPVTAMLIFGPPILLCYVCVNRPLRFGLAVGALLAGATLGGRLSGTDLVYQHRSFFGVLRVKHDRNDDSYELLHGTTLHGMQIRTLENPDEPLTYYHITGPIGQVFTAFSGPRMKENVALIGLGTGTLTSYGNKGQHLDIYDIDPAVVHIARDTGYFTYLPDCKADYQIILGDARLRLDEAPDGKYGLIVVDAFSSDAIPIHLITREALELYFRKLAPGGILALHISNRHLDLEAVPGNLARQLQLQALIQYDKVGKEDEEVYPGKTSSDWVILARDSSDFGKLADDRRWHTIKEDPVVGIWTDDYSNLLSVFSDLRWDKRDEN
jgi:SAM-dependent methyltransferase